MRVVYEHPEPPTNYLAWTFLSSFLPPRYWVVMTFCLNASDLTVRLTRSIELGVPYESVPVPGHDDFTTVVKRATKAWRGFFLPADDRAKYLEHDWADLEAALAGHRAIVKGIISGEIVLRKIVV